MARKKKDEEIKVAVKEEPVAVAYTTDGQPIEIFEDKKLTALEKIVEQNNEIISLLKKLTDKLC